MANIKLIEDPAKNFLVIMKDGKIYKTRSTRTAPLNFRRWHAPTLLFSKFSLAPIGVTGLLERAHFDNRLLAF